MNQEELRRHKWNLIRWGIAVVVFMFATALLLTQAKADGYGYSNPWNMVRQDNGYWLNQNREGVNDGWYWERYSSCGCNYGCKCYKYGWRKVKRIVSIPNPREEGFEDRYINTVYNVLKWQNQEKMVDKLLDIAGDDAVVEGYGEYRTTKTVKRGLGYAPNGSTYGSYYARSSGIDDFSFSQHAAERSLDRAYNLADRLSAGSQHRADMALEYQKNLMAYEAFRDTLKITPQEETTTWEREGSQSTSRGYGSSRRGSNNVEALMIPHGARLNKQDCMACHSGNRVEKDFDVTRFSLLQPEEIDPTWELIADYLDHKIEPGMPKGKPQYSDAKKAAYKAWYYAVAGTEAQEPRAARPNGQRPEEDVPPLPMPPPGGGVQAVPMPTYPPEEKVFSIAPDFNQYPDLLTIK